MLWRDVYKTRVAVDVPIPELAGRSVEGTEWEAPTSFVLFVGFELAALPLLEVWLRLMDSGFTAEQITVAYGLIRESESASFRDQFEAAVPPSRASQAYLWHDAGGAFRKLIEPDRPERTVAMACLNGSAVLTMVGTPTEDAWELFESTVRTWVV